MQLTTWHVIEAIMSKYFLPHNEEATTYYD